MTQKFLNHISDSRKNQRYGAQGFRFFIDAGSIPGCLETLLERRGELGEHLVGHFFDNA